MNYIATAVSYCKITHSPSLKSDVSDYSYMESKESPSYLLSGFVLQPQRKKKSQGHLRNIKKIRHDAEKCVHVTSRLVYCNSLLSGCSNKSLRSLQFIQNAAACVLTIQCTPILLSLNWLPVGSRGAISGPCWLCPGKSLTLCCTHLVLAKAQGWILELLNSLLIKVPILLPQLQQLERKWVGIIRESQL